MNIALQHSSPSAALRRMACMLALALLALAPSLPAQQPFSTPVQPAAAPPPAVQSLPAVPADAAAAPAAQPAPVPRNTPASTAAKPVDRAVELKLPLRRLIGAEDTIVLRNASSIYSIFVPQSARIQLKSCNLHLEFTNSIALVTERSVIRVVLNDIIIAQYHLDGGRPNNAVDIEVPVALMKNGFNRLQFIVAQHYTYKCEDPAAPELYTEINPDTSYFTAVGERRDVPSRLSYLRWWIDEKLWNPYEFNVALPSSSQMADLNLSWGATVTQGVALALNNQPFRVNVASALRAGMDNIVIGTMQDLSGYLTATEIGAINGSYITIKPLPNDPTHCMIIISGRNESEVSQMVYAFGLVNFPLPDSQSATMDATSLSLPDRPAYIRNAPLEAPGVYSFRQFGYHTQTLKGWNTGGRTLAIHMPGDISKEDSSNVELRLHFAYGAALRKDSVFNVFVNQIFQTAIRLDDQKGAMHSDHRLYIPMQAFQPGRNNVDLVPVMVPLFSNHCEIVQDENLRFTLFEDSDLVLPQTLRKARLPSLGLFSQTAFPYSSPPNGGETAVYVTGRDPESVCAAWTLMGKMAQISGALLHATEIAFKAPGSRKNLIVVGVRDTIPDTILEKAPVSPLEVGKMRYLVSVSPKPEKVAASPVEEFLEKVRGAPGDRSEPEAPATASFIAKSDLVDDVVAVQFESSHTGYPSTVITATDGVRLLSGMNALQDRRIWNGLAGDLAVWNTNPDSLAIAKVGPDFLYKNTSPISQAASRMNSQPLLVALILLGVLFVLGFVVRMILRRRERHTGSDEND